MGWVGSPVRGVLTAPLLQELPRRSIAACPEGVTSHPSAALGALGPSPPHFVGLLLLVSPRVGAQALAVWDSCVQV